MTKSDFTGSLSHTSTAPLDIAAATDALFQDIASATGNPALQAMMVSVNAHMQTVRHREAGPIPDLKSEFDALSAAWSRRDLPLLNTLLTAYFQKRRDLATQISNQINRPN